MTLKRFIFFTLICTIIILSTNSLATAQNLIKERTSLTYIYSVNIKNFTDMVGKTNNSLNTVSPSYFDLYYDGTLDFNFKFSPEFVEDMHNRNIKFVPFLSNHWDRQKGRNALNIREMLTDEIALIIEENNLDGINVDLEYLDHNDKDNYTDLLKMLRSKIPEDKEVSIAVAANPYGFTKGWHGSYDYKELAKYADYLMIMTYDESWQGSNPGPVASIAFVEGSIRYALSQGVPAEKIVLGIPFYGRIWSNNGTVNGNGITNAMVQKLIQKYNGKVTFNDEYKSPKAIIRIPKGVNEVVGYNIVLKEGTYEIWFENDKSIQEKIKLVEKYNLNGVGSWSLGQEPEGFWNNYNIWIKGCYFLDIGNHWAKNSILNIYNRGWMLGISSDEFKPENSLTRAEAATIFVRVLGLDSNNPNKLDYFNDVSNKHWARKYIAIAKENNLIKGINENTFMPDAPITREQMATIIINTFKYNVDELDLSEAPFLDIKKERWSYKNIVATKKYNIFTGFEDGTFRPTDNTSRAQMSILLERLAKEIEVKW